MKKTFIGLFLSLLLTIFVSGQALASTATATALLDLTSLSGMAGFTWVVSSQTDAEVSNTIPESDNKHSGLTAGWSAATSTASISNAKAEGSAVAGLYSSSAWTYESSVSTPYATAYAGKSSGAAGFTYTGADALVHFAIPYSVLLDLVSSNPGWAYGSYEVWVSITSGTFNEKKVASSNLTINGTSYNPGTVSQTFVFDVPLTVDQTGTIEFGTRAIASASSAVPLPSAVWLLGTGLVGLVGIRRKRD